MKMRNVHTAETRESIMVSIDFFLFIAESMLFTCKIIQKVVHQTPEFQVTSIHNHTVGRRLLTLPSFELIPPNVERWKTSAPSDACACEITLSICSTRIGRKPQNKTSPIGHQTQF
ncbi:hypothetical protein HKD37_07G017960 [Glycine soja]